MVQNIIITLIWLPQAVYQLLNLVYWLQVKEYRSDRFRSFLKSADGRKKVNLGYVLVKLAATAMLLFFPQALLFYVILLVLGDLTVFGRFFNRKLRKPVMTQRAVRILVTGFAALLISIALLFVAFQENTYLLMEILLLVSPFLGIAWTKPIADKFKRMEVQKAKKILEKIDPLVIGITGSYGKSTTKEFVFQLLKRKYKCEKSTKNENTEFGLARKVINDFSEDTEIFVAEMGAYKKGEIARLSLMAKPKIGVITGIEPQHLDLFGSLDNIKKAKYELISSLPKDGVAIFNASTASTGQLIDWARKQELKKVYTYKLINKKNKKVSTDYSTQIIKKGSNGIEFILQGKTYKTNFTTNLTAVHLIENLTAAIIVARILKVAWSDISYVCRQIETPEGTMKTYEIEGGVFVDDSYNATPKSFEAAVDYLAQFDKRKIFITSGIIELGNKTDEIHAKLGKKLDKVADRVITSNNEVRRILTKNATNKNKFISVEESGEMIGIIEREIKSGNQAVFLVEGRMPEVFIKYLRSKTR
jgi:UDP-N-acetylmuramoyl-tripeptide--D-alanyl-D-alanine ligase